MLLLLDFLAFFARERFREALRAREGFFETRDDEDDNEEDEDDEDDEDGGADECGGSV